MVIRFFLVVFWGLCIGCKASSLPERSIINFDHLQRLTERISFLVDTVEVIHVYSNYPDYRWAEANDSGPEGIACVDDAARAAVVYLRHFELTGHDSSLLRAKALLQFIQHMQTDDGQFYNFILADHSINRDGKTSYKSFGWWAARGVWATSLGYRIFRERDPAFAAKLKSSVEQSFGQLDVLMQSYGKIEQVEDRSIPKWFIHQYDTYTASATSELLIGLCEFYAADPQPRVKEYIEKFVDGLLRMQAGDFKTRPYGAFLSEDSQWHDWANCQAQAIAMAAKLFDRADWLARAEREARLFYTRLFIDGRVREFTLGNMQASRRFPQIAYGVRPMVLGALRLADATGKDEYRKLAGLLATWFLGDNAARAQMYDPTSGRCFDGISDSTSINKNSGAESTIEALYALMEVEQDSVARPYLGYHKTGSGEANSIDYALFGNPTGKQIALVLDQEKSDLVVLEGDAVKEFEAMVRKSSGNSQ